jgi:hypothetical protein
MHLPRIPLPSQTGTPYMLLPDATRRTCTVNTYTCARTWLPAPLLCARDGRCVRCHLACRKKHDGGATLLLWRWMHGPNPSRFAGVSAVQIPCAIDPSYYEAYEWTDAMTSSTHARLQARLSQWQLKPPRCTTMGLFFFFLYQIVFPVNTAFIREHPSKKKNIINLMICRRNLITNKITVLQSNKQGVQNWVIITEMRLL